MTQRRIAEDSELQDVGKVSGIIESLGLSAVDNKLLKDYRQ